MRLLKIAACCRPWACSHLCSQQPRLVCSPAAPKKKKAASQRDADATVSGAAEPHRSSAARLVVKLRFSALLCVSLRWSGASTPAAAALGVFASAAHPSAAASHRHPGNSRVEQQQLTKTTPPSHPPHHHPPGLELLSGAPPSRRGVQATLRQQEFPKPESFGTTS